MADATRRSFLKTLGAGAVAAIGLPLASLLRKPLPAGPLHGPFVPPWIEGQPNAAPTKLFVHPHELRDIQRTMTTASLAESCEYDIRPGFRSAPIGVDLHKVEVFFNGKKAIRCVGASPSRGYIIIFRRQINQETLYLERDDKGEAFIPLTIHYGSVEVRHV